MSSKLPIVILASVLGACQPASTPTAASTVSASSTGFFKNGDVRLSYRLDLPARTGPVGAVVFGHGSGQQTQGLVPLSRRRISVARLCDALLRQARRRAVDRHLRLRRRQGQHPGLRRPRVRHGRRRRVPARPARDRSETDRTRRREPGRMDRADCRSAKARPAFMVLLVGPTVSVGIEGFYSRIVEDTSAPVEEGYKQLPSFNGFHGFDPSPVLESLTCRDCGCSVARIAAFRRRRRWRSSIS